MKDEDKISLALLEHRMTNLEHSYQSYHEALDAHMEKEEMAFKKLWTKLDELTLWSTRYGGIATGVALAVSSLWAVGIAIFTWVRK